MFYLVVMNLTKYKYLFKLEKADLLEIYHNGNVFISGIYVGGHILITRFGDKVFLVNLKHFPENKYLVSVLGVPGVDREKVVDQALDRTDKFMNAFKLAYYKIRNNNHPGFCEGLYALCGANFYSSGLMQTKFKYPP